MIRLEVLIAHLATAERQEVAENLQLPKDSLQRLGKLEILETEVASQLLNSNSPSQIYQLLQIYKPLTLILFAARGNKNIRHLVWQYITKLSQTKPLLNGNDLKNLGFKPGKLYKQILDDVLAATLDGKVSDRASAEEYVRENY